MTDIGTGRKDTARKAVSYILGIVLIAVSINITKLAELGIAPNSSFPRAIEAVSGISLGTATIIINIAMVLVQVVLLRRKFRLLNLLGVPVSMFFGLIIDFFGTDPNAFGHLMAGIPRPQTYLLKLLCYLVGLVLLSIGVFLYSRVNWIMMPGDGAAAAIGEVSGKSFGDGKTIIDCIFVGIALVLQLVFLGGLKSFTRNVVVREGTVLAAVLVGQNVKLLGRLFDKRENGSIKSNER